jgi:PTH1 family peptidyl-tRNA hydrolase
MLVRGDESGFMNRLALAVPGRAGDRPQPDEPVERRPSHIRQARPQAPASRLPQTGPMAAMLKKLFGGRE